MRRAVLGLGALALGALGALCLLRCDRRLHLSAGNATAAERAAFCRARGLSKAVLRGDEVRFLARAPLLYEVDNASLPLLRSFLPCAPGGQHLFFGAGRCAYLDVGPVACASRCTPRCAEDEERDAGRCFHSAGRADFRGAQEACRLRNMELLGPADAARADGAWLSGRPPPGVLNATCPPAIDDSQAFFVTRTQCFAASKRRKAHAVCVGPLLQ